MGEEGSAAKPRTPGTWRRDDPEFYAKMPEEHRARYERLRLKREQKLSERAKNIDTQRVVSPPTARKRGFRRVFTPLTGDPVAPGSQLWAETANLIAPWRKLDYRGWAYAMADVASVTSGTCRRWLYKGHSGIPAAVAARIALWLRARAAQMLSTAAAWEAYVRDREEWEKTVVSRDKRSRLKPFKAATWDNSPPPPTT